MQTGMRGLIINFTSKWLQLKNLGVSPPLISLIFLLIIQKNIFNGIHFDITIEKLILWHPYDFRQESLQYLYAITLQQTSSKALRKPFKLSVQRTVGLELHVPFPNCSSVTLNSLFYNAVSKIFLGIGLHESTPHFNFMCRCYVKQHIQSPGLRPRRNKITSLYLETTFNCFKVLSLFASVIKKKLSLCTLENTNVISNHVYLHYLKAHQYLHFSEI